MENKSQYLENPCRASSIPYWKAISVSVPENMRILHNEDFGAALLEQFTDEPYFRLKHDLQNINPAVIPDGFELCTATLADFADHINSCYGGACVTEDELRSYTARKVYCPELWIVIRNIKTGTIAATGIAELDQEICEGILEWIQVSEEYRRCNLGRCIVNELLWRMKDMAKFATVSGQCNNPWKPEKLYRKCGFAGNDIWHVLKRIRDNEETDFSASGGDDAHCLWAR